MAQQFGLFFVISDDIGPSRPQRCVWKGCQAGWHTIELFKV
jgi:hypothetical protein